MANKRKKALKIKSKKKTKNQSSELETAVVSDEQIEEIENLKQSVKGIKSVESSDSKFSKKKRRRKAEAIEMDDSGDEDFTVSEVQEKLNHKKPKPAQPGSFTCKICDKTFLYKTNLYKHCRTVHKMKYENERVQCSKCVKSFTTQEKMEKHLASHDEKPKEKKNKPGIQCFLCKEMFRTYGLLEKHLTALHEHSFKLIEMSFNSNEEFIRWKYDYELKCICKYVRRETPYKLKGGGRRYRLQCHRSGFFKSRSKGLRKLKKLGSNKIEGTCPSTILVTEVPTGAVTIRNFECHEGHDFSIERLTLTPEDRATIAGKLSVGVSENYIIDSFTSSLGIEQCKSRLNLLNKNDIRNIRRDFGIKPPIKASKKKKKENEKQGNEVSDIFNVVNTSEIVTSSKTHISENVSKDKNGTLEEISEPTLVNFEQSIVESEPEKSYTDLDNCNDPVQNNTENEAPERDLNYEVQTKCEMIVGLNNRSNISNVTREYVLYFLDNAIRALNDEEEIIKSNVNEKKIRKRKPRVTPLKFLKKKNNQIDFRKKPNLGLVRRSDLNSKEKVMILQRVQPVSHAIEESVQQPCVGQKVSELNIQSLPQPIIQPVSQSINVGCSTALLPQMTPLIQPLSQHSISQSEGTTPHIARIGISESMSHSISHCMDQPDSSTNIQAITESLNHNQSISHSLTTSVVLAIPQPVVSQSIPQPITSTVHEIHEPIMTVIHQPTDLNDSFSRSADFVDSGNSGFDTFVSCVLEIGGHNNESFT